MTDLAAENIDVPAPLVRLGEEFRGAGFTLYLVGGFVRDGISGRGEPHDVDATTGARPGDFKPLLKKRSRALWDVGEKFGTIGATLGEYDVEVTTYRSDLYTAGSRHPEISFGDTLEDDLARRDFTINAIAADAISGEVTDPFGGRGDLASGVIRAVGVPLDRMRDDPLRMLRAVRFQTTLSTGERPFAMTSDLEAAIKENAGWLGSISSERIREEFEKIIVSDNVAAGIRTLVRLGLMEYIVPEFMETVDVAQESEFHHKDVFEHTLIVTESVEAEPVLRKAAFFHDIGKPRTLGFEHRCTYCQKKSIQQTAGEGECPHCGGRTQPKQVHFYGHENVGAAIAKRAMNRLAYPKDDTAAVAHLVSNHMRPLSYAMARDPWSDSAVRRFIRDTYLARGEKVLSTVDDLLKLARADITGGNPRRRNIAVESWRSLRSRVDEVMAGDAIEKLESPLDGNDLMRGFGETPGPWVGRVKEYLEGEVVEGRLGRDDHEGAWGLARTFADEEGLFRKDPDG